MGQIARYTLIFFYFLNCICLSFASGSVVHRSTPSSLWNSVDFAIDSDHGTIDLHLNFEQNFQRDVGTAQWIGDKSFIQASPSTPETPFRMRISLTRDLWKDGDIATFPIVHFLPSGHPLPREVASPLHVLRLWSSEPDRYQFFVLFDTGPQHWVGMVIEEYAFNDVYLPINGQQKATFLRDTTGNPRAIAQFFGPAFDKKGEFTLPAVLTFWIQAEALMGDPGLTLRSDWDTLLPN